MVTGSSGPIDAFFNGAPKRQKALQNTNFGAPFPFLPRKKQFLGLKREEIVEKFSRSLSSRGF